MNSCFGLVNLVLFSFHWLPISAALYESQSHTKVLLIDLDYVSDISQIKYLLLDLQVVRVGRILSLTG